jgi:hypothetical protein
MDSTERLSEQMVRDLFWIFSSPPLIQPNQVSFQQVLLDESWKQTIVQSSQQVSHFMADKNLKMLGPYFEALWEFYLTHYPGKNLIAKNVQVFGASKTIGEFDFIYFDQATDQHCHLEVAIKYFLGLNDNLSKEIEENEEIKETKAINRLEENSGIGEWDENTKQSNEFSAMKQWIGPNANDRLDKKYLKMIEQQSQLSLTPEGQATLDALGVINSSKTVRSEICLLGYLFYPLSDAKGGAPMPPPEYSHTNHNRGYWLRINQLDKLLPKDDLWEVTDKPFWLAPLKQERQKLKTREEILIEIKEHFGEDQRPLLISNFIKTNESNGFESDTKYFVVSESWPESQRKNN